MLDITPAPAQAGGTKVDRDAIFFELTRSICPECRRVIDAQILLRDNKVTMRKRCPEHGVVAVIRAEPEILPEKLRALDRLATVGCSAIPVPAIERGVNEHEVGRIVRFGLEHPAVKGINFQSAFHAGRHSTHDPLQRVTIPDVLASIAAQTEGLFTLADFIPVPCCFPTRNSVTYAYVEGDSVVPLPRVLNVDDYLDYLTNRAAPTSAARSRRPSKGCGPPPRCPARKKRRTSSG